MLLSCYALCSGPHDLHLRHHLHCPIGKHWALPYHLAHHGMHSGRNAALAPALSCCRTHYSHTHAHIAHPHSYLSHLSTKRSSSSPALSPPAHITSSLSLTPPYSPICYSSLTLQLQALWKYNEHATLLRLAFVANSPRGGPSHTVLITDIPGKERGWQE